MMSTAFSLWDATVQSTINSQCGQLQSARSHAIRSKFQAWFSSAFELVSLSTQFQSVMTAHFWLSGREMAGMELMRSTRVSVCVWDHCTAGEVICSCCFRFDCKWSILTLKLNRPSYPCVSYTSCQTCFGNSSPLQSVQLKINPSRLDVSSFVIYIFKN